MTTQSPSTLVASDIDLGGCILYYSPTSFDTFDDAVASTKWRKFGMMREGVQLDLTREMIKFFSGFPARLQKQYVSSEDLKISGQMLEVTVRNAARALGGLTVVETVAASSPAPSTVATGSTKTSIVFADITGYAVDDEIRVGDSGSYQYGRIRSIDTGTNTATLYEGLSSDTVPTTGHAIAKIATSYVDMGSLTNPADIALKVSHVLPGGYGSYDMYVIKAQMTGNLSVLWGDNTQNPDSIALPFEASAIADPDVESGKTARWLFTQT